MNQQAINNNSEPPDTVALSLVRIDGGTQPREEISEDLVNEYAEKMGAGQLFEPVVIFFDGVAHWLADGFHRYHAAKKAGQYELRAAIRNGTKRDAILYSVGANATHGKRRTNADKRRSVLVLLNDAEWSQWSDHAIADAARVSHHLVAELKSVTRKTPSENTRTYTTKHGTVATMDVSKIGKRDHYGKRGAESNTDPDAPLHIRQPQHRSTERRITDAINTLTGLCHGLLTEDISGTPKEVRDEWTASVTECISALRSFRSQAQVN